MGTREMENLGSTELIFYKSIKNTTQFRVLDQLGFEVCLSDASNQKLISGERLQGD